MTFTGQTARPYLDGSVRYRCFYPVEAARALGHRAFVACQNALETVDPLLFDLVVVHHPAFTPALLRFVKAARAGRVRLVADYDDLIFDPAHAAASSLFARSWNLSETLRTFARNTDALRLFEEFTVSTTPLREHVLALHPGAAVRVLPNSVPRSLWSMIERRRYQERESRPCVGYFPGTATHDRDFAVAAEGVAAFCREQGVRLRIVGPLETSDSTFRGVEVERVGLLPFADMFDTLADCRVALAPLTPSRFNRAKSHVKLLEAALCCTGCVASDIPDMAQHGGMLPNLKLMPESGDWRQVLQESWDTFDVRATATARSALVHRFGSVQVYGPAFAQAA